MVAAILLVLLLLLRSSSPPALVSAARATPMFSQPALIGSHQIAVGASGHSGGASRELERRFAFGARSRHVVSDDGQEKLCGYMQNTTCKCLGCSRGDSPSCCDTTPISLPGTWSLKSDDYLLPRPPYRMFSFAYNATAGGPDCKRSDNKYHTRYCDNKTTDTAIPTDVLYPRHTYNLLNPAECFNTTTPLAKWLNKRGVACMTWESCWNVRFAGNTSTINDSTVIAHFSNVIASPALNGATALGLDECGDLVGPKWGHLPGDIPGEKKMSLAAKGFRQGKKMHPDLFVAAWNPGSGAETDGSGRGRGGVFSGLMKDHTFNLAMFETYTHYGKKENGKISQWFPRFEYARKMGWLNRSIPCLGMMIGKSKLNPTGWSQAELRATVQELKDRFPEMPGIGFYGSPPGNRSVDKKQFVVDLSDTATLDLITFASKLSKEMYPDQVVR